MQLDGGRGGGAEHILEWEVFGLALGGEAGVLLLEDRQSQHITRRGTERMESRGDQPATLHFTLTNAAHKKPTPRKV